MKFLLPLLASFRLYEDPSIIDFYKQQHENQTLDFVLEKKAEYLPLSHGTFSIFEVVDLLDTLIDESDPDISLPQSYHAYQTAEMMRADNQPEWLVLTGFIHDLGKLLAYFGEPQWAVVGDSYPLGHPYSPHIVLANSLPPDPENIYTDHCGLENVHMTWGHDEYLYHVLKDYLPEEALFIIRYHSFYALHRHNDYLNLLSARDLELLPYLLLFNKYDLYSKDDTPLDTAALRPYYEILVDKYLPPLLSW